MIEYKDDKQLEGVQTFENGDVYQGAFKDGKKHGKGILRTRNDRSYEGEWKYDKPHGFGINTFPNGKIYTGPYICAPSWDVAESAAESVGFTVVGELQDLIPTDRSDYLDYLINDPTIH